MESQKCRRWSCWIWLLFLCWGGSIAWAQSPPTIGGLIEKLQAETDELKQWQLIRQIGMLKSQAAPGVSFLTQVLHRKNQKLAPAGAAWALGETGDAKAFEALLSCLQSQNSPRLVLASAFEALTKMPQAGEVLLPLYQKYALYRDSWTAAKAIYLIGKIGPSGVSALPQLLQVARRSRKALVTRSLMRTLSLIGAKGEAVIHSMSSLASSRDGETLVLWLRWHRSQTTPSKRTRNQFRMLAKYNDLAVRQAALTTLKHFNIPMEVPKPRLAPLPRAMKLPTAPNGTQPLPAAPSTLTAEQKAQIQLGLAQLSNGSPLQQKQALKLLGAMGSAGMPLYLEAYKTANRDTKILLIRVFGRMGSQATKAIPLLVGMWSAKSYMKAAAEQCLASIGAPAVPALIELLGKGWNPRSFAMRVLTKMGLPALPGLLPVATNAKSWTVRRSAQRIVKKLGVQALPSLVIALEIPKIKVRSKVAKLIGSLGENAKAAVPALTKAFHSEDLKSKVKWFNMLSLHRSVGEALAKTGPVGFAPLFDAMLAPKTGTFKRDKAATSLAKVQEKYIPYLLKKLMTTVYPEVQIGILKAISLMRERAIDALPTAIKLLNSPHQKVREGAVMAIASFRAKASSAVPHLLAKYDDPALVRTISRALPMIQAKAKDAVPALMQQLAKTPSGARSRALLYFALSSYGQDAAPAFSALVATLKDPNAPRREKGAALKALQALKMQPSVVVPLVTSLLGSTNSSMRVAAAECLAAYGAHAQNATPTLLVMLKTMQSYYKTRLIRAIGSIGSKEAAPVFLDALKKDKRNWYKRSYLEALSKIGPKAEAVVPQVLELFHDKGMKLHRDALIKALVHLGPKGQAFVKTLVTHAEYSIRSAAFNALANASAKEMRLLSDAVKGLGDKNWIVRSRLRRELATLGAAVVPTMLTFVKGSDAKLRAEALDVLSRLKEKGKTAGPALIRLFLTVGADGKPTASQKERALLLQVLGNILPEDPRLIPLLEKAPSLGTFVAFRAIYILTKMKSKAFPVLDKFLRSGDERKISLALTVLRRMKEASLATAKLAMLGLKSKRISSRVKACALVERAGPKALSLAPAMIALVGGPSTYTAEASLRALGAMKPKFSSIRATLQRQLQGSTTLLRQRALIVLASYGKEAQVFAPIVMKHCHEKRTGISAQAAKTLAALKVKDASFVPGILKAYVEGMGTSHSSLERAVQSIGKAAVPPLVAGLKVQTTQVAALRLLGALGADGAGAVATIQPLIHQAKTRLLAIQTLGRIGESAKSSLPTLLAMLKTKQDGLWSAVAGALGTIGRGDSRTLPALLALSTYTNKSVAVAAIGSLGRLGQTNVATHLRALVKSKNIAIRNAAWFALQELKPAK